MTDASNKPPLLQVRNLTKSFPGVSALSSVDFTMYPGEVHAVLGENGAGKSTLIKVITGVYKKDAGTILLQGKEIEPKSPRAAQALGISTVYQEVNLVPTLSVAENIYLGRQPKRWGIIDTGSAIRQARHLLEAYDVHIDPSQPLSFYSVAVQQIAAIARAVDLSARILILDEPTEGIQPSIIKEIERVIRLLLARNLTILLVEQYYDFAQALADHYVVLARGEVVQRGRGAQMGEHQVRRHLAV